MPLYNDLEVRPRYGSALPSYAPEGTWSLEPGDEIDMRALAIEAAKAGALGGPVAASAGAARRASPDIAAIKAASAATADELFRQSALDMARGQGPASRELLTQMSPDDFLALARDFGDYRGSSATGPNREKLANVMNVIESGTPLSSVPFLDITDPRSKFYPEGRVVGHEGRHRATALRNLGYETMPVRLMAHDVRWGRQSELNRPTDDDIPWAKKRKTFDYVENLPTELGSESPINDEPARTRPAPYHTEGPLRGKALIAEAARRSLGRRVAGGLGRLGRSVLSPVNIAGDLAIGSAVGAGSALAGYTSAAPESAGLFTPPGPGYEGLVTAEDIEAAAEAKELRNEAERQRLLEQYRASGYDLDLNTRLRDLR